MEILFNTFLTLHILGGSIGLLTGTINLVRRKGGKKHVRVGKLFTYGMLTAGFSAFVLSILHPNYFLFMVGVFTLYLVGTGNRYIRLQLSGKDVKPTLLDWMISGSMLLAGLFLIVQGIRLLVAQQHFGLVLMVFGLIGLRFVTIDVAYYRGKSRQRNDWLLSHLQRMTGGYIASLTAFLVVNAKFLPAVFPSVLLWLLPTFILTPLIIFWSRKYKGKP
ncbi:MAG: hypothetical protein KGO92_06290 [Bacteroidota bacterium]|nr:hypothetical protein [Bacteroidota bacterium]